VGSLGLTIIWYARIGREIWQLLFEA